MQSTQQQRLEVRRGRPGEFRSVQTALAEPGPGEVLLQVDRFGLSANNVTYAALGVAMHYADFFPSEKLGGDWSMLPVWGVARVLRSHSEWVRTGDQVYGYFPSASHCVLRPQAATSDGFRVEREQIPEHFSFYHRYGVAGRDPLYVAEQLDRMVVLRPLFMTSLLLSDYLSSEKFSQAEQFVMSSAGSKTALGTANALAAHSSSNIIGLASAPNHAAAEAFGGYSQMLDYAQLEQLPQRPTVYVDFSGDAALRDRLAKHLGSNLTRVVSIGMTHWHAGAPGKPSGDYASEVFFAPAWASQRKQTDPQFAKRIFVGWQTLLTRASAHYEVAQGIGMQAIGDHYAALVKGDARSDLAHSFSF